MNSSRLPAHATELGVPGLYEAFVVFRRVHAGGGVGDDADLDALAEAEDAQLLELLQSLQRRGRRLGEPHEEVAAVGVEADVLEELQRLAAEIRAAVAD